VRIEIILSIGILSAAGCDRAKAAAGENGVPGRVASIELQLGSQDGSDVETFSGIAGLTLDSQGRIYVADTRGSEVRVFAPDGAFLFRIGRQGSGPGEFDGPCCLRFDRAGRLWVRDGGNARYSVFSVPDTAAELLFTVRMAHGDANFWAPIHFDDAGRLIDVGHRPAADRLDLMHFHVDTTGMVADTLRIPAAPAESIGVRSVERNLPQGVTRRFFYPPFGPRELVAHGERGEYAKAISSQYHIAWYDPAGKLLRVIQREGQGGAPVRDDERAEAEKRIERDAQRFGLSAAERFSVPDRKQPLSNLVFDQAGRLWVLRSATRGAPRKADVWDRNGGLVFTAEWPADVDLSFNALIDDSVALAVSRDSLDVERVVRLRWR
jgi:hypothetical protein